MFFRKINFKITSVQDCSYSYKKHPFIAFFDTFLSLNLDDKLFDQPAELLGINLLIAVVLFAAFLVPKYIKEDLQQIFKTVLEA